MSLMTTDEDKPHRTHYRKYLVSMNPASSISKCILTLHKRFYRYFEENRNPFAFHRVGCAPSLDEFNGSS
jgi:hypothetical protein